EAVVGRVFRAPVVRVQHLGLEQLAVGALDAGDLRAGAEEGAAEELRVARLLGDALAVIARRRRIGDVVAGGVEVCLRGIEASEPDVEQGRHDVSLMRWFSGPTCKIPARPCCPNAQASFQPASASAARSVLPPMMRVSLSAYIG